VASIFAFDQPCIVGGGSRTLELRIEMDAIPESGMTDAGLETIKGDARLEEHLDVARPLRPAPITQTLLLEGSRFTMGRPAEPLADKY